MCPELPVNPAGNGESGGDTPCGLGIPNGRFGGRESRALGLLLEAAKAEAWDESRKFGDSGEASLMGAHWYLSLLPLDTRARVGMVVD